MQTFAECLKDHLDQQAALYNVPFAESVRAFSLDVNAPNVGLIHGWLNGHPVDELRRTAASKLTGFSFADADLMEAKTLIINALKDQGSAPHPSIMTCLTFDNFRSMITVLVTNFHAGVIRRMTGIDTSLEGRYVKYGETPSLTRLVALFKTMHLCATACDYNTQRLLNDFPEVMPLRGKRVSISDVDLSKIGSWTQKLMKESNHLDCVPPPPTPPLPADTVEAADQEDIIDTLRGAQRRFPERDIVSEICNVTGKGPDAVQRWLRRQRAITEENQALIREKMPWAFRAAHESNSEVPQEIIRGSRTLVSPPSTNMQLDQLAGANLAALSATAGALKVLNGQVGAFTQDQRNEMTRIMIGLAIIANVTSDMLEDALVGQDIDPRSALGRSLARLATRGDR